MKNRLLPILAAFAMVIVTPAHAAYIIKKAPATKAPAAVPAAEPNQQYEIPVATPPSDEAIKNAVDEFRDLPRAERRERIKAARQEYDNYKSSAPREGEMNTLLLVIIA